ncbi:hypothetical protein B0H11DRAFT_2205599 [Mycena galericulata]|nr:hypothetical protein B0H11DRAFT_2205599 [Mycena galericulata]
MSKSAIALVLFLLDAIVNSADDPPLFRRTIRAADLELDARTQLQLELTSLGMWMRTGERLPHTSQCLTEPGAALRLAHSPWDFLPPPMLSSGYGWNAEPKWDLATRYARANSTLPRPQHSSHTPSRSTLLRPDGEDRIRVLFIHVGELIPAEYPRSTRGRVIRLQYRSGIIFLTSPAAATLTWLVGALGFDAGGASYVQTRIEHVPIPSTLPEHNSHSTWDLNDDGTLKWSSNENAILTLLFSRRRPVRCRSAVVVQGANYGWAGKFRISRTSGRPVPFGSGRRLKEY